jgi:dephospho-CoA kinase
MKLIGLTGGVGSGKSTVAGILHDLGADVVDADEASHAVYAPGTPGFDAVVREFGPEYVRDGQVDRARLGRLVFDDADARQRLNAIVHPLVREWMAERTREAAESGAEVVIQDVPLLYENGLEDLFSSVVLVYVPEEVQLERLVEGRGLDAARARAMIAAQMPIDAKRRRAHHVIDNSGTREETRRQVEEMWAQMTGR